MINLGWDGLLIMTRWFTFQWAVYAPEFCTDTYWLGVGFWHFFGCKEGEMGKGFQIVTHRYRAVYRYRSLIRAL